VPIPKKFKLKVLNPGGIMYDGEIESLFVKGDTGEFELLAFHYPVISILLQCRMVIDWNKFIEIKSGILRFFENECTIIAET
jgi:F0F1-type ATP synthase epsilon subunit